MKLGIIVVYLVKKEDERLLDLHLTQIERNTRVHYTIYGSANRLPPEFRLKLKHHPRVKLVECGHTELRDSKEHAFYLEQLLKVAIDDGATHIATLHVDSFPVRADWADELGKKLSETCVLAAVMRDEQYDRKPNTACIFFHRNFYLKYRPTFRLSDREILSSSYKRYQRDYKHVCDSGVGYGFKIHTEGLSWQPLLRCNKGEDHYEIGSIYGDLIFHLGSANRKIKCFARDDAKTVKASKFRNALVILRRISAPFFPIKMREKVNILMPRLIEDFFFPQYRLNEEAFKIVNNNLLDNPESYLHFLRTGFRQ